MLMVLHRLIVMTAIGLIVGTKFTVVKNDKKMPVLLFARETLSAVNRSDCGGAGMKRIALLGQPNSGKSTVFNRLTGSRLHVGNWPGKTVERKEVFFVYQGQKNMVVDLPGSYGLSGNSDEEVITLGFIKQGNADLVCILVDAWQLAAACHGG